MFIDLAIGAHAELFRNTQSHVHVFLVIAYLASLHGDLGPIVQLALKEDILSQWG